MSVKRNVQQLPLSDKTIAVTRSNEQAKEFSQLLEHFGAQILLFPAVEIVDPQSWSDCDSALAKSAEYSGIIFTSANAVGYFFQRAKKLRVVEQLKKCRMFAVGEKTKNVIDTYGLHSEKLSDTFSAEQLANEIVKSSQAGERFLFPKGNLAKNDIKIILSSHGIVVDAVTVYCTQEPPFDDGRKKILKKIEERSDMVTFFSPSSVNHFVQRASSESVKKIPVAVIGETTAETARREGMNVVLISPQSTAEIFADSILQYYTNDKKETR